MNIAIFSGSFDPIHIGHLIIADYICQYAIADQVWLSATPQNPLKCGNGLTSEHHRKAMVKLAIKRKPNIKYCNIEEHLPSPSYTASTLKALKDKYPEHNFSLVIGSDNWYIFDKWRDNEYIKTNHKIIIYPRQGYDIDSAQLPDGVVLCNAPVIGISSTFIRDAFKNGKNINYYVTRDVYDYINKNSLYK